MMQKSESRGPSDPSTRIDLLERILPELSFRAVRSSGPGGQNVNKVSSKVELRWLVTETRLLRADTHQRLLLLAENKISKEGVLVLVSDRFRDQIKNKEDCLAKLRELVVAAGRVPKKRKKTKIPKSKIEKRLDNKRRRSSRIASRKADGY